MDQHELKYRIKKKFGSVQRFLRLSGVRMKDFNRSISDGKESEFWKEAQKVIDQPIPNEDLSPELLKKIRDQIYIQYGNQTNFCTENGLSISWISALLNGKNKRISKKVRRVMKILNLK